MSLYQKDGDALLVSYVDKKKKKKKKFWEKKHCCPFNNAFKCLCYMFYDHTKGGVDVVDF